MKLLKNLIMPAFVIAFITLTLNSCYYDNEEEMYNPANGTAVTCDTSIVTYALQIKPIFDSKCISCHSPAGSGQSPFFDNATAAHDYAVLPNNRLMEYVNAGHQSLTFTACEKAQFNKWINTGAN